jgi:LuxR family transcriptional regulator, maltose regulon positive regulatory protein
MDNTLLLTKTMVPAGRPEAVVRERLHARLREGADRALTLVSAGPGFGKSTLLEAWRKAESPRRGVAWLALEETENDPVALCAYIVEALRTVRAEFGSEIRAALATPSPPVAMVLRELGNEIAAGDPVALVLDDFHRVRSPEALGVIAWLVEHSPPEFQLVISTRADPRLPLSSLRAHAELIEVRAADLAFTAEEAQTFLGRLGLRLSGRDVAGLIDRTEGWPAGVYLAALSVRNAGDPGAVVRRLGASSWHIVDFLVNDVLAREPPELQAFMLRCSILERISASLCDAVLERDDSHDILSSLWRSNLFLTALGEHSGWYRFHHLFADVLRVELESREPALVPVVHRRAAAWYREAGDVESAISHALAGGAFDDAADMAANASVRYRNERRAGVVQSWLGELPSDVVSERGALVRAEAGVIALRSQPQRRSQYMELLAKRYLAGPDNVFRDLVARAWSGDARQALALARRLVATEPTESESYPLASHLLGWFLYVDDQLEEAVRYLSLARVLALDARQWVLAAAASARISLAEGERDRRLEQQRAADAAQACLVEHGFADPAGYEGSVHTARGAALAAHGRLSEARELLERGLQTRPPTRFQILDGIVPLIAVVRDLGEHDTAATLFAEAQITLSSCPDPGGMRRRLDAVAPGTARGPARVRARTGHVSEAELRVLRLLDEGYSKRKIAAELYVSFNTVHSHTKSIYRKLGVNARTDAVAEARRLGLLLPVPSKDHPGDSDLR